MKIKTGAILIYPESEEDIDDIFGSQMWCDEWLNPADKSKVFIVDEAGNLSDLIEHLENKVEIQETFIKKLKGLK